MKTLDQIKTLLPSAVGARFEKSAESHLRRRGLRTVARNYRCREGEIDLIMDDGEFVVFVEVRYRRQASHGHPLETITLRKQQRIIRAASHFLNRHSQYQTRPCRFDAIGVSEIDHHNRYDWIRDAFST